MDLRRLSETEANYRKNLSASTGTKAIFRDPLKRSLIAPNETGDTICVITQEAIKLFPSDDVFTTLTGIAYHKPSLKLWLQENDRMPHNNMRSQEEILRLWPLSSEDLIEISRRKKKQHIKDTVDIIFISLMSLMATAELGLAAILFSDKALRITHKESDIHSLRTIASGAGIFTATMAFFLFRDYKKKIKAFRPLWTVARKMTDEERKKAELGVEYYDAKVRNQRHKELIKVLEPWVRDYGEESHD